MEQIHHHTFANGLTLVAERMGHVRSAALNFLVPAGCAFDPPEHRGIASVLSDLITRGAGDRDSRELSIALDNLGVDHSESVGVIHTRFWGGTLARNLPAALELYADILMRPRLPKDEIDAVRAGALQELIGLRDEHRRRVVLELQRLHFPPPLGQDRYGTEAGIESLSADVLRRHYRRYFQPAGSILSVAGNIEWGPLREQVGRLFADWRGDGEPALQPGSPPGKARHLTGDTHQTQIAIAYDTVPIGHPDFYNARAAVNVLDGGMSARLFTEVREKRALCYAISASYQTFKDRAAIFCYAGTTTDRAQQTLDVTLAELRRLQEGIEQDEVERVRVGLKSSLVMEEESTSARASRLASDWYYFGRVRGFAEISAAIDALTPEGIVAHVRRCPPRDFTVATLGKEPLEVTA